MSTTTKWVTVGSINDVPRRGARCIKTTAMKIALFRTGDDQFFALEDACPHKGGPLSQGIVHDASVTCPLHNWVLSLETGEALGADAGKATTVPVRIEGEAVQLLLDLHAEQAA